MRLIFHCSSLMVMFSLISNVAQAQRFVSIDRVVLPDSLQQVKVECADLDNDGLADIVVFARSSNTSHVLFIKGDTIAQRKLSTRVETTQPFSAFAIYDYDNDNQLDIVLSPTGTGQKSFVLRNEGDFAFESISTDLPQFSIAKFADLNNDGSDDGVLATNSGGSYHMQTYSRHSLTDWQLLHDTLIVEPTALELYDFNRDGETDIFFSGKINSDSITSIMMLAENGGYQIARRHISIGKSVVSDVDGNGFAEVILFGKNYQGQNFVQVLESEKQLEPAKFTNSSILSMFSADLDSDGLVDLNTFQVAPGQDSSNLVTIDGHGSESLTFRSLVEQKWIDFDQDGDLDLAQLLHSDHFEISFIENVTTQKNKAPVKSSLALAVPVYDRTLIFWTSAEDDHTVSAGLTYDLLLQGPGIYYPANFDLVNGKRLLSAHGNNGSATFRLVEANPSELKWAVQAIDNSLFGGAGSICMGSGSACVQTQVEKISACAGGSLKLESEANAHWFSFANGFVGTGTNVTIKPHEKDTVFSFVPSPSGCSIVKVYEINVGDGVQETENELIYACTDSQVTLAVPGGWQNYVWTNSTGAQLGSTSEIAYVVTQPAQILAEYSNSEGCRLQKEFDIRISVPSVDLSSSEYHIMKGQSAQLSASGGAMYHWTPATGLSNAGIANPIATPLQDTQYTVTVTDSVGCSASASVTVFVETSGFIPSLFTPNSDGQNDLLKIYGLSMVNDFKLRIYNREGNIVFKTESVNEAVQSGWDGKSNGVDQPNGVYFWKVEGKSGTGRMLLLNGKNEGSIVLLR